MLGSHDLFRTSPGMGNGFAPLGLWAKGRPLAGDLLYIREKTGECVGSL